jgi:hypothetical protein
MRCAKCKYRQRDKLDWEWAECECEHAFNLVETEEVTKPQFHAEFGCRYYEERTANTKERANLHTPNNGSTPCSVCGGTGMSVVWKFCPECGRVL